MKILLLPFGKIDANRSCSEVGIAPVLCHQALAHVQAVSCRSSGSASPGDHHAWLDSKPQRYTDTSVILTPLWHYRERNSVQRGANQGRETGSSMRHLQTRADPCNAKLITRNEIRSAVRVRSSALPNRLRKRNTRNRSDTCSQVSADFGSKTVAGSRAVGHPMIRRINVTMQRSLRLDQPVW